LGGVKRKIIIIMNQKIQKVLDIIQHSQNLNTEEKESALLALMDADKELEITSFKFEKTEKVKKTTAILLEETIEELEQKRKAVEAQNRELEIETALERVRSKAMAMHSSEDLSSTVGIFFKELKALGIIPIRCGVGQIDEATRTTNLTTTTSSQLGDSFEVIGKVKQTGHPVLDGIFENWKLQKEYHPVLEGDDIKAYYGVMNRQINYPEYREGVTQHGNIFYFKEGFVFAWTEKKLSEEELKIFRRFTSVLSLTYRRYLDLKEAEAQAREAQIEAALERVRSKAMAMHSSEDLAHTVDTFFSELNGLNVKPHRCGVGIMDEKFRTVDISANTTTKANKIKKVTGKLKLSGHPVLSSIYENWKLQKEYHPVLHGNEIKDYYQVMNPQITFPDFADDKIQYGYYFFFEEGGVFAWTDNELAERDLQIFRRYTSVLSLTYRRYMDLKEAEAQAREAQIETALERVRSKTMAMHKSDELADTAAVVFKQLINLGIEPNRIYIGIIKDEKGTGEFWVTDEDGSKVSSGFTANLNENSSFQKMFKGWQKQIKSITIDMQGKELQEYFRYLSKLNVPFKGGLSQKRRVQNIAYFSQGFIGIASPDPQPRETIDLLERFAAVFNLTYTRFNDLMQAEAQNKIIQAENKRKTQELEEARELQLAMLPKELPQLPHVDIAVYMQTATEVGGDYYDFSTKDDGSLNICLGDATGHGMKAGIMVSSMKSIFTTNSSKMDIESFFATANSGVKSMGLNRMMMGFIMLNIKRNVFKLVNAGMPPIYLFRRKSKSVEEITDHGMPIGAMNHSQYNVNEKFLDKGDVLLLMSDGMPELHNDNNEMYGYNRIRKGFGDVAEKAPEEIVSYLKNEGSKWMKDNIPDDDVTFVVIKVKS
jgi:stage II sporulation SpoE-like protein